MLCIVQVLSFASRGSKTLARPDLAAYFKVFSRGKDLDWSGMESAMKVVSKGTSVTEGIEQAVAYTTYLLQARPDRVAVQGLYVGNSIITFIITDASGARFTTIPWKDESHFFLLCAFIDRLHDPLPTMVDPTIQRRKDLLDFRWDITVTIGQPQHSEENTDSPESMTIKCEGYQIDHASASFGSRSHIFKNLEFPTKVLGHDIHIIKDQYSGQHTRFTESQVLEHIHTNGPVPGMVDLVHHEKPLWTNGNPVLCGDRVKNRILMSLYGTHLDTVSSVREALIAIYDTLEITRYLYCKRQVLHRDISYGNVLIKPAPQDSNFHAEGGNNVPPDTFCSMRHLLDSNCNRQDTQTLLIDFNRAEILGQEQEPSVARTGTPIFISRAVLAGGPLRPYTRHFGFPPIPALLPAAKSRYSPDRLKEFEGPDEPIAVYSKPPQKEIFWRHELRHDAESVLWLLIYWAIQRAPATSDETSEIPADVWAMLTTAVTGSDSRGALLIDLPDNALHTQFAPLLSLLKEVGEHIIFDPYWVDNKNLNHPEYIHEVFQRLIFNFVIENDNEAFMDVPLAAHPRKVKNFSTNTPLSTIRVIDAWPGKRMHSGGDTNPEVRDTCLYRISFC
ncbi:hypothetical protein BDZ97DRAFT_1801002 [Flammula alnicola]|nr:hypothetical protein BDZ97DRAFT_1801002 [Flammula alnicola]